MRSNSAKYLQGSKRCSAEARHSWRHLEPMLKWTDSPVFQCLFNVVYVHQQIVCGVKHAYVELQAVCMLCAAQLCNGDVAEDLEGTPPPVALQAQLLQASNYVLSSGAVAAPCETSRASCSTRQLKMDARRLKSFSEDIKHYWRVPVLNT